MAYAKKYIPGVYLEEGQQDLNIVGQVAMSVGGLLAATKGPCDEVIQVGSENELVRLFGTPTDDNYNEWIPLSRVFKYRVGSLSGILQIARVVGDGSLNGGMILKTDAIEADSKNQLVKNHAEFESTTVDFGTGDFKFITRSPSEEKLKIAVVSGATRFQTAMVDTTKGITFDSQFKLPLTKETEIAVVFLDEDGNVLERFSGELPDLIDEINRSSTLFYFSAKDPKTIDVANLPFSFEATDITVGKVVAPVKADYIKALKMFEDIEGVDINYMIVNEMVYNETITLCQSRKDCMFKGGVPVDFVRGVDETTALGNCKAFAATTLPISSTYGSITANAVYVYDHYNKKNRWVNISGDLAGLKIRSNLNGEVFDSDAFLNRGVLVDVIAIAQRWTGASIRELSRNKMIPVILKRNVGFVKWGQNNFTVTKTPVSEEYIRELCIYIYRALRNTLQFFLGEKNDSITRTLISSKTDRFMKAIKASRGITAYFVQCDEQNNSEEDIANGLLFLRTSFVPTFAITEIILDISVSSTTTDLKIYANGAEIK